MLGRSALIAALLLAPVAAAQAFHPPRTAFGQPDLQGMWSNESMTHLERPKAFKGLVATPYEAAAYEQTRHERYDKGVAAGDPNAPAPSAGDVDDESAQWTKRPTGLARVRGEIRTSWIVEPADGRLPFTPASRAASAKALKDEEIYDDPEVRPFDERCLLGGGGGVAAPILNPDLLQIIQTRDHVVLSGEQNHEARIVRLGGRHPPPSVRTWMGDSIGWWEGDTLVVETTNLSPNDHWRWTAATWIPLSPSTRIVERFTRTGQGEVLYSYVVSDPANYTQDWKGEMPYRTSRARMFEFGCHEGNYALRNILAGARAAEARQGAAAP